MLVHFAADTDTVFMSTRLAGATTHFLPFNKGNNGGAGNGPDPQGRSYRTAYLWEEVLQRDSLLDLLVRFIHLQVDEKARRPRSKGQEGNDDLSALPPA
jgi:type I restriction enzyme R subunit